MARASAGLPAGIRLGDHISFGVIAGSFPPDRARSQQSCHQPPFEARDGVGAAVAASLPAKLLITVKTDALGIASRA